MNVKILNDLHHYNSKRKKFSRFFTFTNFPVKAVFVENIFRLTCLLALKFIYFNLIFKATDISLYCYLLSSNSLFFLFDIISREYCFPFTFLIYSNTLNSILNLRTNMLPFYVTVMRFCISFLYRITQQCIVFLEGINKW